jgi:hypothetical protein
MSWTHRSNRPDFFSARHCSRGTQPRANTTVSGVFTKVSPRGTVCVPMLIEIPKTSMVHCVSVFRSCNGCSCADLSCEPANESGQ